MCACMYINTHIAHIKYTDISIYAGMYEYVYMLYECLPISMYVGNI